MLPEFAENIRSKLLLLPPENWDELTLGDQGRDQIPIELSLDPDALVQAKNRSVFITPIILEYLVKETGNRGRQLRRINSMVTVSSVIVIPFSTFKSGDVGEWAEIKKVLLFREYLESNIMGLDLKDSNLNIEYSFADIRPEPPMEIELNHRNFLAVTEYTFELMKCV